MIKKKDRTIDLYKKIGAEARLFRRLASKLVVDSSKILSAEDTARLMNISQKINTMFLIMEDQMYSDHPDLGLDYTDVFRGDLDSKSRSNVDAEVKAIIANILHEIMGGGLH